MKELRKRVRRDPASKSYTDRALSTDAETPEDPLYTLQPATHAATERESVRM